jgi:hypothetical protein
MRKATIEYPIEPSPPAYHIPLSDEQLRMLGELCAVQGQIELLMQLTVAVLRKVSVRKARKLLGSPNLTANAAVWLEAVEKHAFRQDIKELARAIYDEIDVIRRGRKTLSMQSLHMQKKRRKASRCNETLARCQEPIGPLLRCIISRQYRLHG